MLENIDAVASNKDSALLEIGYIRGQASVMGFNDHEIPTLNRLMDGIRSGTIDPDQALAQARAILPQKQDYH